MKYSVIITRIERTLITFNYLNILHIIIYDFVYTYAILRCKINTKVVRFCFCLMCFCQNISIYHFPIISLLINTSFLQSIV